MIVAAVGLRVDSMSQPLLRMIQRSCSTVRESEIKASKFLCIKKLWDVQNYVNTTRIIGVEACREISNPHAPNTTRTSCVLA